jgi:hypothetical protein
MNLNQYEVVAERRRFGGDKTAISRHSVRCFRVPGHSPLFHLDKTLSGSPPFYEIYHFPIGCVSENVPVNGERYWGDGLTWKEAVAVAGETVQKLMDSWE